MTLILGLRGIGGIGAWALRLTWCLRCAACLNTSCSVDRLRGVSAVLSAVTLVATVATTAAWIASALTCGVITLLGASGASCTFVRTDDGGFTSTLAFGSDFTCLMSFEEESDVGEGDDVIPARRRSIFCTSGTFRGRRPFSFTSGI